MMRPEQHTWNSGMFRKGRGILSFLTMTLLFSSGFSSLYARSRTIGATLSYTGVAVSYEHATKKDNSCLDLSLKVEFSEFTSSASSYLGASASLTWNSTLKEWTTSEGNTIGFFAGPGVVIGYGKDFPDCRNTTLNKVSDGVFFGIKGKLGVECRFTRKVNLTASVSPIIGSHLVYDNGLVTMKWYRKGLYYALVPEIGIKYRF